MPWHESHGESLVVFGAGYPNGALAFVMLQHLMPQFVQENFFDHKPPQRVSRPILGVLTLSFCYQAMCLHRLAD